MLNIDTFNEHAIEERRERELEELNMIGGDETSQATQVVRNEEKIGRNDPCPCGSGKKYKKCCGS